MSGQRPSDAESTEHEVGRVLRQASDGYPELPAHVGDRLDRVLEGLPAPGQDTARSAGWFERLAERLRPRQARFALISAAAAVLVTVGAVAAALQSVTPEGSSDASGSAEVFAEEQDTARDGDGGAGPGAQDEEAPENDTSDTEAGTDEFAGVPTYATGSDYASDTDLLAALQGLGSGPLAESGSGEIPAELADLAAGGDLWQRCQEAIVREYPGLLVAVDFARYESEPAILALVTGDSGDTAVALTPACGDGVIEPLAVQP
jgi:hypothetical protein